MNNSTIPGPGELLGGAWDLYKKNWKILSGIVIVPSVCTTLGSLLNILNAGPKSILLGILSGISILAGVIFYIAMQPTMVKAIDDLSQNPDVKIDIKKAYAIGFRYFWPLIFVVVLQVLVSLGAAIFFVIPAIVIGIYSLFYVYSLVLDGKKGFDTFTDSFAIVSGRWWGTLGRMISIGLVLAAASLVSAGVGFLLAKIFGYVPKSAGDDIVAIVLNFFVSAVMGPVASIYIYRFFIALKKTATNTRDTLAYRKWLKIFLGVGIFLIVAFPIASAIGLFKISSTISSNVSNNTVQSSPLQH